MMVVGMIIIIIIIRVMNYGIDDHDMMMMTVMIMVTVMHGEDNSVILCLFTYLINQPHFSEK